MQVHGQCHCGHVRFTAQVDPEEVRVCHCTDCQTFSGSAYKVSARAPAETFVMQGGEPKIYVKTAESGAKRAQAFCPTCGTSIYSAMPKDTPAYMVRVGSLAERAQLTPKRQTWTRSSMPWCQDLGDLPASADQGGAPV